MVSDIARRLHDLKSRHGFSEYFRSGWKILLGDEAWNLIDKGDDSQGTLNTLADALLKQHPTTADADRDRNWFVDNTLNPLERTLAELRADQSAATSSGGKQFKVDEP